MLSPIILIPAILNGLLTGAVYALVALGLTLIYGVLHNGKLVADGAPAEVIASPVVQEAYLGSFGEKAA